MKIGFVGLGKMGAQIVSKLLVAQHELVVYDVNPAAIEAAVANRALGATDRRNLVTQLGDKPIVWLMIPADYVQAEVDAFIELLPAGSILIDGGNSRFTLTIERAKQCAAKGINFVDVGTSGGIMGLENGFSMMVGGDQASVETIRPILDVLSRPNGGHMYAGQSGAGHYVKMIHNGIEYGMMQAYAEGYELLKSGPIPNINLADVARVWQQGSIINSTLNELTADILANDPELTGIDGFVAASGEGQWTAETAAAAGIDAPALQAALAVRTASQTGKVSYTTKLLAAMRNAFGGHAINKESK